MADHETPSAAIADALPESLSWPSRPTAEDLNRLPGCPAVYLFVDSADQPVQLLTSQQLKRTAAARLGEPDPDQPVRTDLAAVVRGVRWRPVFSRFEARWRYYQLARILHPREYRKLVSFGPAWFLHVDWSRRIPELRVSERVWNAEGEFVGPWPTHQSCRQALEGLWDVFDLCRYPEQVRKAPAGARCAYADMGRCDAPCDGAVPIEQYVCRNRDAWRFASGGVDEWTLDAQVRMKQAAVQQEFEKAGLLKNQIEFARSWRRRWSEIVRPAEDLNFLLIIPATRRKAWKLFLFRRGDLIDGPLLAERKLAAETPSWLLEQLSRAPAELSGTVRMEETWLAAHFMHHKESGAAIVVHLAEDRAPADLEESLSEALKARRAKSAQQAQAPGEDLELDSDG